MIVAAIEITQKCPTTEIQNWLDAHPSVVVYSVTFSGNFCYIFYT